MHVNYLDQDPIYRKHSLCAIVVIGKFLSVPRHLIKPVAPWGERISLFYLNQFVSPHGLSTEPGQQVLPDGPLLLPAVSAAGPCREGLSLWLWPFLPQPRLSSGNFPWQLPRSGLTLGLVSSCGWIFLFEKYFKQLVGKRWRGGKRIINKLVKGRLSKWLGAARAYSLTLDHAKDWGAIRWLEVWRGPPSGFIGQGERLLFISTFHACFHFMACLDSEDARTKSREKS